MDAASRTGVADARELIEGVRYRPVSARYKVYIIDEVHMLSTAAFNALLKTLEEPPPHVKFVFATTEIRKVPVTVLSRCQRFDLKRVPQDVLVERFGKIAELEKVEISPEALALIARAADGSVRDGLSMLDQAIAHGGGVVDAAQVRDMLGLADRSRVLELFEKTMRGDAPAVVGLLGEMHDAGADPVVILQDLLELTHWVTRMKIAPEAGANVADSERTQGLAMAQKLTLASLTRAWALLMKGLEETLRAPSPAARRRDGADPAVLRRRPALARRCAEAAAERRRAGPSRACAAPPAPRGGGGGGGAAARLATRSRRAPSRRSPPRRPRPLPNPRSFTEVVALFESKREARLVNALMHHVHEVRCEPGLIEFRPEKTAPTDLASRLSDLLGKWTGRRWIASVSQRRGQADAGAAEGGQRRHAAQQGRGQSAGAGHIEDIPRRQAGGREAQGRGGLAARRPARRVRRGTAAGRGISGRRRHTGKRILMFDKLKDLGGLMQQAQQMQQKIKELQDAARAPGDRRQLGRRHGQGHRQRQGRDAPGRDRRLAVQARRQGRGRGPDRRRRQRRARQGRGGRCRSR